MTFYTQFLALFYLFALLDVCKTSLANKLTYGILSLFLIMLVGFRYGLETDYWSYYALFNRPNILSDTGMEIGFRWYNYLFKKLTALNFNAYITCTAFIFTGIKTYLFSKTRHPFVSMALYVSVFMIMNELNAMRQGMALMWIMVGVYHLSKDRIKTFVLCVLVACSFHLSSVLAFIILLLYKIKFSSVKQYLICLAIAFVVRLAFFTVFIEAVQTAFSFIPGASARLISKLLRYFADTSSFQVSIGLIRKLLMFSIVLYCGKKEAVNSIYTKICFFAAITSVTFSGVAVIAYRLPLVFDAFSVFAYTNSIKKLTWNNFYLFVLVLFICAGTYFQTLFQSESAVPYRTYF